MKSINSDFCKLINFTTQDLAFAIKNVNITGYTGQIWFPRDVLIRAIKSYYLFNPTTSLVNASMVGVLNVSGAYINNSAVTFVEGKVPVSSKSISLMYFFKVFVFSTAIIFLLKLNIE